MVRFEGSTVIARPREDVFDVVADETQEPRYNPGMLQAVKVTPGPVGSGTTWAAKASARGHPVYVTIEVTEFDRPARLASTSRMNSAEITGAVTFEQVPEGTRLRWSWDVHPRGVLKVLGPFIGHVGRQREAECWAGLKEYLEHPPPEAPAAD
jgi:uncharacterized protein YndB with AHSA1/START domain